jgi:hypothetical protein
MRVMCDEEALELVARLEAPKATAATPDSPGDGGDAPETSSGPSTV